MPEYMPTTEEIRDQVAWQWDIGSTEETYAYAAFDRWLDSVKDEARTAERERIATELIDGLYCDPSDDSLAAAILRDYGMHLRRTDG